MCPNIVDARAVVHIPTWRHEADSLVPLDPFVAPPPRDPFAPSDPHGPLQPSTLYANAPSPHDPQYLFHDMSRAKGFTSLPPYQWVKKMLIASVGVMGSDPKQRLHSTLDLAILLYVGEQVSESLIHLMGFQGPPHVVKGCTTLLQLGAKVIPRGYAHLRAMLQQLRYYCAKNVARQDSATPHPAFYIASTTDPTPLPPSLRTLGESCGY